jgi:hypothetical protein
MLLSILIPTIPERRECFSALMSELHRQVQSGGYYQDVEILYDDRPAEKRGGPSTGEKRNSLDMRARSEYIWRIDDDDMIMPEALGKVITGCKTGADVIGINGYWTENGSKRTPFEIRLGNPYIADYTRGHEVFLRYPNHITPVKREKVIGIRFPYKSNFEDKEWADAVKSADVLKTQYVINEEIYHYNYSTHNKLYA